MSSHTKSTPIAVTGCTGLIGAHVVDQLLEAGHTVHACVRNPQAPKCDFLRDLGKKYAGNGSTLRLMKTDLMDSSSYDEAFKGCKVVITTAASVAMTFNECPFKEIVLPAVEGSRNVARAAIRAGVERIVNTSSVSSLLQLEHEREPARRGKPYNETELRNNLQASYAPYQLAKQRSELVLNDEFQTGTVMHILPTWSMGPQLGKDVTSSHQLMKIVATKEKPLNPMFYSSWVDLRDVAAAHILCATAPMPAGRRTCRYILSQGDLCSCQDFAEAIRRTHPHLQPATRMTPWLLLWAMSWFDKRITSFILYEKSQPLPPFDGSLITRELGFKYKYTKLDDTVRECMSSLIAHGHVKKA